MPEEFDHIKSRERVRDLAEVYTREREADAMLDLVDNAMGYPSPTATTEVAAIMSPENYLRKKYLEPSCGNGNFLVRILARKFSAITRAESEMDPELRKRISKSSALGKRKLTQSLFEYRIILALTATYGIDIDEENVIESRERLLQLTREFWMSNMNKTETNTGFWKTVEYILDTNIIVGDSLTDRGNIIFVDFIPGSALFLRNRFDAGRELSREFFTFAEVLANEPKNRKPFNVVPARHYLSMSKESEE